MEQNTKISLDTLYLEYNKRTSKTAKDSYLKATVKIKPYVSYLQKDAMAKKIIDTAHYSIPKDVSIENLTDEELLNGFLKWKPLLFLSFVLSSFFSLLT